ncbi:MAG: AAA family ATPase [Bacteroidota bacterium]
MNKIVTFSQAVNDRKLPELRSNDKANAPELYKPSPQLWQAVTVALELGLPLLLTGEPGTGKTDLANYIAWYFHLGKPLVFDAQTTSSARDLFYRYDALAHFQYAQTSKEALSPDEVEEKFIEPVALGRAIKNGERRVVLLDEIDKAPRDLPNNLLAALDKLTFSVPETGDPKTYTFSAPEERRPVIILTSNSEKGLPDPFLRRVAFFDIKFPGKDELLRILADKLDHFSDLDAERTLDLFEGIRKGNWGVLNKIPSTAELLHWSAALLKLKVDTSRLDNPGSLGSDQKQLLGHSLSVLAKTRNDLKTLREALGL